MRMEWMDLGRYLSASEKNLLLNTIVIKLFDCQDQSRSYVTTDPILHFT